MGVVVCPSTMLLVEHDIKFRCQASRATVIVGNGSSLTKFARVRKECPLVSVILQIDCESNSRDDVFISLPAALSRIPDDAVYAASPTRAADPAMIYFTSGTAGPPKMVLHNHISYPLASTITGKHWLRLAPGKVYWALTEQGWAKAAWAYFGAWNCGASLFIEDDTGAFDRHHTLDVLHEHPITTFCAPPTVYRQLVLDDSVAYFKAHPPKALAHCTGAGEPLNPEAIKIWESMSGIQICDGYGQTESILVCGNFEGNPIKFGSMGKPSPGVPLSLVDDEGKEVPANEEGNIAILAETGDASPGFFGLFDGYLREGGVPDRPLCRVVDKNGKETGRAWFLTGDRATRDAEGYFWFVGRADDVINSSGYRIGT
jgi:medium-chain acyl-CoA synthetase